MRQPKLGWRPSIIELFPSDRRLTDWLTPRMIVAANEEEKLPSVLFATGPPHRTTLSLCINTVDAGYECLVIPTPNSQHNLFTTYRGRRCHEMDNSVDVCPCFSYLSCFSFHAWPTKFRNHIPHYDTAFYQQSVIRPWISTTTRP